MRRMTFGRVAVVAIALAAVLGGPAATSAVMPHRHAVQQTPVVAPLVVYGGRSLAQQRSGVGAKLDAALAGLARHAEHVPPGSALRDLKSLNPAARFMVTPRSGVAYVAVDAITRGDPQALKRALVGTRPAASGRLPERRRRLVAADRDRDRDASHRTAFDARGSVAHAYGRGHVPGRCRAGLRSAARHQSDADGHRDHRGDPVGQLRLLRRVRRSRKRRPRRAATPATPPTASPPTPPPT